MQPISDRGGTDPELQYARLRASYDAAFRHLVAESLRQIDEGETNETTGNEAAMRDVQNCRDALADFLLSSSLQTRLAHSRVQMAAYFVWVNAGCPAGTSTSDWSTAQHQLAVL
jgi:hypothetical protein